MLAWLHEKDGRAATLASGLDPHNREPDGMLMIIETSNSRTIHTPRLSDKLRHTVLSPSLKRMSLPELA